MIARFAPSKNVERFPCGCIRLNGSLWVRLPHLEPLKGVRCAYPAHTGPSRGHQTPREITACERSRQAKSPNTA
jgi:hypothetical protein